MFMTKNGLMTSHGNHELLQIKNTEMLSVSELFFSKMNSNLNLLYKDKVK